MAEILGSTRFLTFQSAAVANGNGTLADVGGASTLVVNVTGITTATINFEAVASDGDTPQGVLAVNLGTGAVGTTTAANGLYLVAVAGLLGLRCRISSYSSGTITITGRASNATPVELFPTDVNGAGLVQGNIAAGTADSGNPVEVGGVGNNAAPAGVTAGQRQKLWLSLVGRAVAAVVGTSQAGDATPCASAAGFDDANRLLGVGQFVNDGSAGNWNKVRTPTVFKDIAAVSVTAGTPQTVWTPTSGKKFRLMGGQVATTVAASVIFKDGGNSNAILFRMGLLPASIGQSLPANMGNGILGSAANGTLNIDVSVTGVVSGFVFGTEE